MRSLRLVLGVVLGVGCGHSVLAADPNSEEQKVAPTAFAAEEPQPVLNWGEGRGKSYWVPVVDIVAFDTLLNLFDRAYFGGDDFDSNWSSFKRNLKGDWVYDDDPFQVNQFGHPYQGSMYHGFARSAGMNFWEGMNYSFLGSLMWELAGETTPPSINDQITTSYGGPFLGEPLFRMASLVLESGDGRPGFWRELAAFGISPATGFNRYAYGDRFDGVFRSHDPAVYTRFQLGANVNTRVRSNVDTDPTSPTSDSQEFDRGEAIADFTMDYGLPGKPGYRYDRPFDYFHFQVTAASSNYIESIATRGLLLGEDYNFGPNDRGVWGIYGNYEYVAPQIFRISATSVGLGTTNQWWLNRDVALQNTLMAGVGYGAGGTIRGSGDRDYHSGITPHSLVALRLIFGDRAALETNVRDYYVSDHLSRESGGAENILRGDVALTVRVHKLHGVTLRYAESQRDAHYPNLPDIHQSVSAISLSYTYLGHKWFGAVDWRPEATEKD